MKDEDKTNEQFLNELAEMRQHIAELESAEAELRQAEEAFKQHAAQLTLLNDISGKIAVLLDLDSVLERAVHLVQEGFGYHHVALFTLDRERRELVMQTSAGDFADLFPPGHHLKLRQGVVGWAGYYGKSLLSNDVDTEPRYANPYPDVIPTRSELSVPIGVGGEVVGVLDIQSPQRNAFDEDDVLTMEALAGQIAVAIKNARLYDAAQQELAERKRMEESLRQAHDELEDRVEERTAELSEANERLREEFAQRVRLETIWRALQQLGTKLAHLRDEEMILEVTVRELNSLGLLSILFKLDDSGQELRIVSLIAWSATLRAMRSIMGSRIEDISLPREKVPTFDEALNRGEPLYLADVLQRMKEQGRFIPGWDRFLPYLTRNLRLPTRGILASLVVKGKPIGLLVVSSDELSEAYVPIIGAFARTMSAAVENARLYEQAQQEIAERVQLEERLAAIYQLGQELTLLRDEDIILRQALETAASVLQFDSIGYGLVDEATDELVYQRRLVDGTLEETHLHLPMDRDEGIGVAVVRGGQALNVPDTRQDARYYPPSESQNRSELCVPMKIGDQVIGVLNAESIEPDYFTLADQQVLQILANQTAVALENARLYRASQEQVARLTTLNTITAAAVSSLELNTVLHQVLDMVCHTLGAAEGAILLRDSGTEELTFALILADDVSGLQGTRLKPGQGIAGWVAQHGRAVLVNDVRLDPRWHDGVDAVTGFETRSLLCAPVKHAGEITGVIEVVSEHEGQFTDEDLSLLEAVASIAAGAMENARLYTDVRTRADELSMLNEIGLVLTATLDPSTVIHTALSLLKPLFGAENVSLLQPDPQTGNLRFVRVPVKAEPGDVLAHLPVKGSVAGRALERGRPILIEDIQSDPSFPNWVEYADIPTRALMAAPLLTHDHAIGVIEVASSKPGAYTREQLQTLGAIASTLTVALENARLYEELKATLRERQETQTRLIHAEKMSALGRLVASIAHEINNPLQSVQGCLTLAEEELDGSQRREKMDRYLGIAGSEIERISTIVQRMREFYRPAREGMQPTDVHTVLESVLALTDKQLQHSNVAVERAWNEELPVIQANADQLKQVFLNLVLNAIDAMPEGGPLRISTDLDEMMTRDGRPDVPAVRIEFSDVGGGIPERMLPHVFEPFYTTKESGSGLGLYTSYGIVEFHNGQIAVTSEAGVGTTFTILLPVEQP